jgi:serine/threonine-protein kinase SRPK3
MYSSSDDSLSSDNEEDISEGIVGEFFNNRYLCLKYLGRGTFCRTWLVYDFETKNFYAMKILGEKFTEDGESEISIFSKVNNLETPDSRIIKLYDHFESKGCIHLIIELMGICILDLIDGFFEKDLDIPILFMKSMFSDILKGIKELHDKEIIHTDIKGENIMIDTEPKKIRHIKEWFMDLKFHDKYLEWITYELPENFLSLNTDKRKKIKKKCRVRALKRASAFFKEELVKYNETEIEGGDTFDIERPFTTKIIDLGNCELMSHREQDMIQIINYRPPENIIGEFYDTKSDIWTIGCILYEMILGDYMFNIDRRDFNNSLDCDRGMLHRMYEMLGIMPLEMTKKCDFSKDLFDSKGRIINHKTYTNKKIHELLMLDTELELKEAMVIEDLLIKMLNYDPKLRLTAEECLKHSWFNNSEL